MKRTFHYFILSGFLIAGISCTSHQKSDVFRDSLVSHIDSSMNPADDFFLYANGKWFKEHPIPESEQSNGIWQLIQDTINNQVFNICESSSSMEHTEKGSNKQKIGDFYFTGMDSVNLNKRGLSDLRPVLDKIQNMNSMKDLAATAAYLSKIGAADMFGFSVNQDDRISNKYSIYLSQGGLSLPDRDYYFDSDGRATEIRKKFKAHLISSFKILGYKDKDAITAADQLYKMESDIARACRKREDTRDPLKNYNKMTVTKLQELYPNFNWLTFMQLAGIANPDTVVVAQMEFFKAFNKLLVTYTTIDWKNYLSYNLLHHLGNYCDDNTFQEFFKFYNTALRGVKEPKPRWKRVVEQTDSYLGDLIGQVYVSEYLPAGTKEKLLEIGEAIRSQYVIRINNLEWMSDATKVKALTKLKSIMMKVGYPDHWKDMSKMKVERISYVLNVMQANQWWFGYVMSKFGKPVDRTEWDMEPQTYNAYYNPSNNEIVVPGCNILVPGYERKMADDALLYSVIGGSTFGHEITHGFDDQGSKYDEHGNLHNWWTSKDSIQFYARTKKIVQQFNHYIAVDSLHVNGELTQGENIADLGGIIMGFEAFKKTKQYRENQIIGGLSPNKRFFLGYALAWMVNERSESVANQIRSDEHAPAKFRVIGPLSNMESFYEAFDIKKGDKMWRADSVRVKIW